MIFDEATVKRALKELYVNKSIVSITSAIPKQPHLFMTEAGAKKLQAASLNQIRARPLTNKNDSALKENDWELAKSYAIDLGVYNYRLQWSELEKVGITETKRILFNPFPVFPQSAPTSAKRRER